MDVYHEKKWGYVGYTRWVDKNSDVVCKSLNCGEPRGTKPGYMTYISDNHTNEVFADDIQCNGNEKNLWDCPFPGWHAVKSTPASQFNVNCSKNPTVTLEGEEGCAGFVKLDEKHYVCSDGWKKAHAEQLCQRLGCGSATESPISHIFKGSPDTIRPYSCLEEDLSIWQCVDWTSTQRCSTTPVTVTCSGHLYFRLKGNATVNLCSGNLEMFRSENSTWQPLSQEYYRNISKTWTPNAICKQLKCGHSLTNKTSLDGSPLHCSEKITISLKDNGKESKCYGLIHLTQQGKQAQPVCEANNNNKIAAMVCRELDCGEFMFSTTISYPSPARMTMSCPDHAESLWHCQQDQNKPRCQMKSIICSGSINVRLSDGLDRCSGRVEIYYKGAWRRISKEGWKREHSDIVCSEVKCGKANTPSAKLFVDGSIERETLSLSLDSSCKATDPIHKCLQEKPTPAQTKEFFKVVCQDHHVFFVNGSSSCSGTVWVEQEEKTYALSGQANVWNDRAAEHVCQKMQCGHMANFSGSTNRTTNVLKELACFTKDDCKLQAATSKTTETAEVMCTDNVVVTLTNENKEVEESKRRCSGHVQVCQGTNCRGVCNDVWIEKYSIMLCENLGCGKPIKIPDSMRKLMTTSTKQPAIISSVHCPKEVSNLSQCSFVGNSTVSCSSPQSTVHIVCSGSLKSKLSDLRDKCAGTPEVLLSGSWFHICGNENAKNTVCKEVGCGEAVNDSTNYIINQPKWEVTCENASESLANCSFTVTEKSCQSEKIRCSGFKRLLVLEHESACKGPVYIMTSERQHPYAIRSASWGHNESKALCKSIGCGNLVNHSSNSQMSLTLWNKSYSCPDGVENIWDCTEKDSSVSEEQLNINCLGTPKISLTGNCSGEVIINGKDRVCSTGWTKFMSRRLCISLGCGNPVDNFNVDNVPPLNGEAHYFSCTGEEFTPLQCASQKGNCGFAPAFVVCSGSLKFNLPDQCGGEIQVFHGTVWKPACLKSGKEASLLCEHFNCGKVNNSKKSTKRKDIKLSISCKGTNLHYCETMNSCGQDDLTEIFCDGFKEKPPPPELPVNLIVGVSFGLLLLVIAVALVLWQRRRIMYLLRGTRRFPQTTSTVASDDFDDIELQVKKDRDVGLKNQANGQGKGLDSQASSEYDDIDEEADAMLNGTDEAPPLPARGGEVDDADDYTEGYDDVDEPPLEEEEDTDKLGMAAQPEETSVPVSLEKEEDYIQPDGDE